MVRIRRSKCLGRHLRCRLGAVENVRYALLRCTFTVACGIVAYLVLAADTFFWFLYDDILCKIANLHVQCVSNFTSSLRQSCLCAMILHLQLQRHGHPRFSKTDISTA